MPATVGWVSMAGGHKGPRPASQPLQPLQRSTAVIRYILRRILFMIPVALLVSFLTFMMIHLIPGDPARILL